MVLQKPKCGGNLKILTVTPRYEPFFQWLISTVIRRFNGGTKIIFNLTHF